MRRVVLLSLVLAALPAFAATQSLTYPVRSLSFATWCRDVQNYLPERCDARLPDDIRAFEEYRSAVERYELNYLRSRDREQQIENDMRDNDPSVHRADPDVAVPPPQ